METRKVQITGRSTYVVSLPKTWVKKVNITNGDSIVLIPRSDGTLLINPKLSEKGDRISPKLVKTINIDSTDQERFIREFIGVYLAGYNIVEMNFKGNIPKTIRNEIRKLSHSVIGPEIIDETNSSVTVKDLLDSSDFSMVKGVKRMYIITRGMFQDAMTAFQNLDYDLAEDVISRDNDVDKLYWLISKQFNLILKDVFFADKMGVKPQEALGYLLVARSIERIADHASKLCFNLKNLSDDIPLKKNLEQISGNVLDVLDGAINAFYRNEFEAAHGILNKSRDLGKKIEKLNHDLAKLSVPASTTISLAYIIDSLDRAHSYAEDIAETAINHYFVSQEQ